MIKAEITGVEAAIKAKQTRLEAMNSLFKTPGPDASGSQPPIRNSLAPGD